MAYQQCLLLHQRQVAAQVSFARPHLALSSDGISACTHSRYLNSWGNAGLWGGMQALLGGPNSGCIQDEGKCPVYAVEPAASHLLSCS